MTSVFIVGSEGTTGLRLKERLSLRGDIRLLEIDERLRKDTSEISRLMECAEFTFLCLPDDAAREISQLPAASHTRIIDTSTAHRTDNKWAYGFPELSVEYRAAIISSSTVSSPGCHSSGFLALVRPLVAKGLLSPDSVLTCTSLTGYSGGGKKMIAQYEDAERSPLLDGAMLYSMGQKHKHIPEMTRHSGLSVTPLFLPVVGDFYSGMLVTIPIDSSMLRKKADRDGLLNIYRKFYGGSGLIRVSDDAAGSLYANQMSGRDDMRIFVSGSDGRFLLCALFDNLGKGASGAAIQCLNIMCGLPDEAGLIVS